MKIGIDLLKFDRRTHLRARIGNYLRVILLWCPIATLIFSVGLSGFDVSLVQLLTSLICSILVATTCMVGEPALRLIIRQIAERRGLHAKEATQQVLSRRQPWLSFVFLLPGLYIGFFVAEKVSTAMGKPWEIGFRDYSAGMVYGILISGALALMQIVRELKETRQAAETRFQKLENENLKAQISALTAQMNPHLLFNTLNTIASAISTDPASAEEMVLQLSDIYRGVLKSARDVDHSLAQELQLCRAYLEIEKRRFGARIMYRIKIDESIEIDRVQLPVLLLQPLIENAIQHGIGAKIDGGSVSIEIRRDPTHLFLTVTDDGVGPAKALPSRGSGTGLANAQSRLQLKYGEDSQLSLERKLDCTVAQLKLPYLEVCS